MSRAPLDPVELMRQCSEGHADVRSTVEQWVGAIGNEPRDHRAWGQLCEMVGLSSAALREYRLQLQVEPDDVELWNKLAQLNFERGDTDAAVECWRRVTGLSPADRTAVDALAGIYRGEGRHDELQSLLAEAVRAGYPEERAQEWAGSPASEEESDQECDLPSREDGFPEPSDADCVRMSVMFAGREDVYARQWCRPDDRRVGYTPIHEPLTPAVIRQHLLGAVTIGVYPIRLDQTALWFAIDLDIIRSELDRARRDHRYATELRTRMKETGVRLLEALREIGLDPLFENSGYKGRHYWVFLQEPWEARVLHELGRVLLRYLQPHVPPSFSLEFFPKQGRRSGKGLGNLIKLPLGIHQRTGYRSMLLDDQGKPLGDPFARLRSVTRLDRPSFQQLVDRLHASTHRAKRANGHDGDDSGGAGEGKESSGEEEGVDSSAALPLWPPDAPPPWTEADFDTDPEVRHVLRCCPVLMELKNRAEEHRRLSHDEQVVLTHTLGHLPGGPQAVNYLISKCVDYSPETLLKSPLKGNPISCPKIRKRIGHVTRTVPCCCDFSFAPNHYPTPVLHLEQLTEDDRQRAVAAQREEESLEQLLQRYTVLVRKREELESEWRQLHDAVCRALAAQPNRELVTEEGRFYLETEDGVETLKWQATGES